MSFPSATEHKNKAASKGPLSVAVVTVSDTRTADTDVNGQYLRGELEAAGHIVHSTRIVRDEPAEVSAALEELAAGEAQIVLFNGGTGISRRDRTFDVLSAKLEKTLPGFGEIFRMLSYEQVGAAAMLSRATAGVYRGKVVISNPGTPAAVKHAWQKLIAPEMQQLAWELTR
jgi:molybdenum cofactor biosynthesis protein B